MSGDWSKRNRMTRRAALGLMGEAAVVAAVVGVTAACSSAEQTAEPTRRAGTPAGGAREGGDEPQREPEIGEQPAVEDETPAAQPDDAPQAGGQTVRMQDIRIMSGFQSGVLTTAMLRAGKSVSFDHWDGEGHKIIVTEEHIAQLKRGEAVRFRTTRALYHDHAVVIDPRNVVKGSTEEDVPV